MKKLLVICSVLFLFSFVAADNPLTKKERKYALNLLRDTEKGLEKAIKGLSPEQLTFKPSEEQWSVEGCVKHIAFSEQMLGESLEKALAAAPNPEKRSNIKATDEDVVKFMQDRTNKVKTMDPMKPENIKFVSTEEALAAFKLSRDKLINFMESTQDDMREHVVEFPFGSYDAYQLVLFIAAHSNRHTQQIEEVKASAGYPE